MDNESRLLKNIFSEACGRQEINETIEQLQKLNDELTYEAENSDIIAPIKQVTTRIYYRFNKIYRLFRQLTDKITPRGIITTPDQPKYVAENINDSPELRKILESIKAEIAELNYDLIQFMAIKQFSSIQGNENKIDPNISQTNNDTKNTFTTIQQINNDLKEHFKQSNQENWLNDSSISGGVELLIQIAYGEMALLAKAYFKTINEWSYINIIKQNAPAFLISESRMNQIKHYFRILNKATAQTAKSRCYSLIDTKLTRLSEADKTSLKNIVNGIDLNSLLN